MSSPGAASLWPGSLATVQWRPALETSTCMQKLLPGGEPPSPEKAGYKSGHPAGSPGLLNSIHPNMARVLRGAFCLSGVFALLALAVVVWSTTQLGGVSGGFVRREGAEFVVGGSSFLFNGFNSYWMMHVAAEPGERRKVSDVFGEAAAAGLSVCRTWAFSDGLDGALQVSPGVYDERVFQGLDFVVSEARRYGIRLILSLVNNFDDFGGRKQYVQWARSAGGSIDSDDDFYTNAVVKGYYRNHVKVWAQEMAAYTKSLDGNHLLEVGMEGFYGDSTPEKKQYNPGYQVGTDFITTNLIGEVDFATIHAYPDIWLSGQTEGSQDSFVQRWMWSHWQDAMTVLKKPLVFAEFGKSKRDPGYTVAGRDAYIDVVYGDIYRFARSGGAFGGGLIWQIMAEGMDSYYDGYEIVLSQDATTDGVIARQSHLMTALQGHTMSRQPPGSTLSAAANVKAAQELSGLRPQAVHRPSSQSLRRHGGRHGGTARSETPPSK